MVIIMIIDHGNGNIGDGFDYYVYCDGDDGQAQDGFFCEELDEEDFFLSFYIFFHFSGCLNKLLSLCKSFQ